MKRILYLIMAMCLLLNLNACTAGKEKFTVDSFAAEVNISASDDSYKGILTFGNESDMTLTLVEPTEISDLTFVFKNGKHSLIADDVIAENIFLTENSPAAVLFDALRLISREKPEIGSGSEVIITLDYKGKQYYYTLNSENKTIKSIICDSFEYDLIYIS